MDGVVLVPVMNCSVAGVGLAAAGVGLAEGAASPGIVAAGLATVALAPAGYLVYDGLSQGDYFNQQPLAPGQTAPYQPPQHQGILDQSCGVACPVSITEPFGGDQTATLAQTPIGYKPFEPGSTTLDHPGTTSNLVPNTLHATRKYDPTPALPGGKHGPGGWGTFMPLDPVTAQKVLNEGIQLDGDEQVYGLREGVFYEFRPDNAGTYHGYPVPGNEVPTGVLREFRNVGRLTKGQYNRAVRGQM